jgi:hypothetical protein
VLQAGRVLKQNIIDVEAVILNLPRDQLDIEDGVVVRKGSNFRDGLPLKEPTRIGSPPASSCAAASRSLRWAGFSSGRSPQRGQGGRHHGIGSRL